VYSLLGDGEGMAEGGYGRERWGKGGGRGPEGDNIMIRRQAYGGGFGAQHIIAFVIREITIKHSVLDN